MRLDEPLRKESFSKFPYALLIASYMVAAQLQGEHDAFRLGTPPPPPPSLDGLFFPDMTQAERATFCSTAPWWTAPVLIGGSGGSGTRGSALLLHRLGVGIACLEGSPEAAAIAGVAEHCNKAMDFGLLAGRARRAAPLAWLADASNASHDASSSASCAVSDEQSSDLLFRTVTKRKSLGTLASALLLLRRNVRPEYQRPLVRGSEICIHSNSRPLEHATTAAAHAAATCHSTTRKPALGAESVSTRALRSGGA